VNFISNENIKPNQWEIPRENKRIKNSKSKELEQLIDSFIQEKRIGLQSRNQTEPLINSMNPPNQFFQIGYDLLYAESELVELLWGEKNIDSLCEKVINFMCRYLNVNIGGIYLNEFENFQEWTLRKCFPSSNEFLNYFHWDCGYHLILESALKNNIISTNFNLKDGTNFILQFVPILSSCTNKNVAVLVFGSHTLTKIDELNKQVEFLNHLTKIISNFMVSLHVIKQNFFLLERLHQLEQEIEKYKTR